MRPEPLGRVGAPGRRQDEQRGNRANADQSYGHPRESGTQSKFEPLYGLANVPRLRGTSCAGMTGRAAATVTSSPNGEASRQHAFGAPDHDAGFRIFSTVRARVMDGAV